MQDTKRRMVGYGVASAVVAGLIYGGFVYRVDADLGTQLSSARVQLGLAMSRAAGDPAREALLARVEEIARTLEATRPGLFEALELRAYLAYARGDRDRAITLYGELLAHPGCLEEYRSDMAFNRAGILEEAGRLEEALTCLRQTRDRMSADDRTRSGLRQARILDRLDRRPEARELLVGIVTDAATTPMRLLTAAQALERMQALSEAGQAYQRAAAAEPVANYYLARLKVQAGEFDTGLTLLERAVEDAGPRVRELVRGDEATWQPCAETERFKNVMDAAAAAPAGR